MKVRDLSIYKEGAPPFLLPIRYDDGLIFLDESGRVLRLSEIGSDLLEDEVLYDLKVGMVFSALVIDDILAVNNFVWSPSEGVVQSIPVSGNYTCDWSKRGNCILCCVFSGDESSTYFYRYSEGFLDYISHEMGKIFSVGDKYLLSIERDGTSICLYDGSISIVDRLPFSDIIIDSVKEFGSGFYAIKKSGELFFWCSENGVCFIDLGEYFYGECEINYIEPINENEFIAGLMSLSDKRSGLGLFNRKKRGFSWLIESSSYNFSYYDVALFNDELYTMLDSSLVRVDLYSGEVIWRSRFKNSYITNLVVVEQGIIVGYSDAVGLAAIVIER